MTTIVQSCLDTQHIETTTVKLKVATPKSIELNNKAIQVGENKSSNLDLGAWSFLQVLSNVSSTPNKETTEKENVYVHPLTKQYSSSRILSEKSLELCTENLGSETGSDDIVDINILSLSPSNSPRSEKSWLKPQEVESSSPSPKYKVNNSLKFPPPLTTISGSNSLQFRPHREDGRLVIQAVETPSKRTYFQAERSHGRLRLSFLKDRHHDATKFDSQETSKQENEVVDSDNINSEDDNEGVDFDHYFEEDEDYYQLEDPDDDDDDEENIIGTYVNCGDTDDNIFDVEVEMGRETFQRLMNTRCNEGGHGNKGLCNWPEPLCVATS
ncbi:hypothetical protein ACH5RR_031267 [Cinchona calisaya]|uniref:FAF domain-containing protein n=1 Tax=Cinchona calisaya TaxID=153742 RepID=A0ABD2YJ01_9GENT